MTKNRIEVHIETLCGNDWHHYAAPDVGLNRAFMISLESCAGSRGLPADVTFATAKCYDRTLYLGNTTPSVLGPDDIARLQMELYKADPDAPHDFDNPANLERILRTKIADAPICEHRSWDGVRIIAWTR